MSMLLNEVMIQNAQMRLALCAATNVWSLTDKRANVTWSNHANRAAWLGLQRGTSYLPLTLRTATAESSAVHCRLVDPQGQEAELTLVFRLVGEALQVFVVPDADRALAGLELFAHGLEATAEEGGDALLPIRMGLLLPAAGDKAVEMHLGTYDYEGAHLAMAGLLKGGAVLLVAWHDPYATLNVWRTLGQFRAEWSPRPALRLSVTLTKTARSLELRCLGPGDLSTLGAAYRERATALGYRVPWAAKLEARPQAARLFGACNVKLWTALRRRIDKNLVEQSVEVQWTFDEVAQIAEHLRHDLQLNDVLFHLGGWTRYGYDVRHPDIMPANPECGGNEALRDCIRRVQACGYLFCLHDNYQDMYRDAASWDEAWLQKDADGSPHMGGVWLGGQAYYTCAREAVKLAQRPQNLPLVRNTFRPDLYFIDTTYAVGAQECYDPRHPLTRQEDIHWKQALSDYARDLFGLFGSECGREWAVAHADFFEGLASVSGGYYHRLNLAEIGARVVPFFDMVFHDCIALHGKYGYKPETMAEQVIHHVAMGRTLYYHSLGNHLYWQDPTGLPEVALPAGSQDPAAFTRAHNGWAEGFCLWDRFMKNTQEVLGPLYRRTAEAIIARYDFLDSERLVRRTTFSNGCTAWVNGSDQDHVVTSPLGGEVVLPPFGFLVEAGTFVAFHARSWGGRSYPASVLFTLASLDGRPVAEARSVRVFHGFGDAAIVWRNGVIEVQREMVLQ